MTTDEKIYVAGPICFFPRGGEIWQSRRREAQYYGFTVTLPNDNKRPPAQSKEHGAYLTLKNCRDSINLSTGIIADLENFRGSEPDGGTIYEIGMAYGHDCRCYAFTRDKRPMGVKYNAGTYTDGGILDFKGRKLPHIDLPFGVCVLGACKVIEGTFSDALKAYMCDLEEESKKKAMRGYSLKKEAPRQTIARGTRPIVYVADIFRYEEDAAEKYAEMKKVLEAHGFDPLLAFEKLRYHRHIHGRRDSQPDAEQGPGDKEQSKAVAEERHKSCDARNKSSENQKLLLCYPQDKPA